MKKHRAEKALPKNGPTKRVGSGRLVLRLHRIVNVRDIGGLGCIGGIGDGLCDLGGGVVQPRNHRGLLTVSGGFRSC